MPGVSGDRSQRPRSRRRSPIVGVAAGALLIVGAAVATAHVVSREAPKPQDTVEAWLAATKAGDETTLHGLACAAAPDAPKISGEQASSLAWTIDDDVPGGDTSSVAVDVTYTVEGFLQSDTWTVAVAREGEHWKVCGLVEPPATDPDTPRTALEDWMDALVADDVATVQSLTCAAEATGVTAAQITGAQLDGFEYEIVEVTKVDDADAEVAFTITVDRNGGPVTFEERWRFVREPAGVGHAWKVCGPVRS
jgi:hypothetical protein